MTRNVSIRAGRFSVWLAGMINTLESGTAMNVPCGNCAACCASSYFIHIRPDERRTIRAVPAEILFPAPGLPEGNLVLGFDEDGRCPMFRRGRCSIYSRRPFTCRIYDCRIFTATGIPAGDDKPLVNERAHLWKFDFVTSEDRRLYTAVRRAAGFLEDNPQLFPRGSIPFNTTQRAVLAISAYSVFYRTDAAPAGSGARSPEDVAAAMIDTGRMIMRNILPRAGEMTAPQRPASE